MTHATKPFIVALAAGTLAVGAFVQDAQSQSAAGPLQTPLVSEAPAPSEFTDAELMAYDGAITRLRVLSEALNGAQPTAEQQGEMATVVQQSGLAVERYNAIARASADNPAIRARIRVLKAPMPAADSVAANVTEDELRRYVVAVDQIRDITGDVENGRASPEEAAALARAVQGSGLSTERYNAIATAVFESDWLRARANVIRAKQTGENPA
ncbi:DUF4168 domain-containing protein [Brevundimonas nasdae]|uniref:DUF4168 domain-containing protein n=1 Tax=Brevundimonas nasdae TaxID=172043 RepID=A0ABX8TMQ9_9CAUL|nr:DUF4168 domain-containing protein [Brevundimonas nasdae]QYC11904.1 DUF4168 domain-containing protein [Brevundimonas nasdae]QYC14689.1 DUF4168 domain-containing protein [Brevundimonas nasdae]